MYIKFLKIIKEDRNNFVNEYMRTRPKWQQQE